MEVHRLSYGCSSVFKLTPSVFMLTLIITSLYVHQLLYGRPSVPTLTSVSIGSQLIPLRPSISFHLDIHHLCVHPEAIKRTSIRTSVDVHQLSYGRSSVFKMTSVSFHIDVHQYLSRRPSAFMRTSIRTSVDIHQLSRDIHKNLFRLPSAYIWTFISTSVDIHQFSSRHPSSLRTSISHQTDVHKNLCGRPSAFIRTSISI